MIFAAVYSSAIPLETSLAAARRNQPQPQPQHQQPQSFPRIARQQTVVPNSPASFRAAWSLMVVTWLLAGGSWTSW